MTSFFIRILLYEYIDNGNLYQWLHGSQGEARPLKWDSRMKIIQGIAKGSNSELLLKLSSIFH